MLVENAIIEYFYEERRSIKTQRILWISPDRLQVVTFDLDNQSSLPEWTSYHSIVESLSLKIARILETDPYMIFEVLKEPSEKSLHSRDKAWSLIGSLVMDEPNIYDEKLRGDMINDFISRKKRENDVKVHKTQIYRKLRRYWRGGKTKNALFCDYRNCGAPGVARESQTGKKRGRKPAITLLNPNRVVGVNITEDDRQVFRLAITRYYHTRKKNPLKYAFDRMLDDFYNIGFVYEKGTKIPILPPSATLPRFEQFKYYYYKERKLKDALIKRFGERNFNLAQRAATGNSTSRASGPGAEYEIDATIGNFHLVHTLNRLNIGKPVTYYVKDVFSRLVTGFSVGLNNISWRSGIISLENASTDKVQFCAGYGITITSEEWPSYYLPKRLLADRGEFESDYVEDCIENLGVVVSNTPPYRGDFKPFVEQHFRIMDSRTRPMIPGGVKKGVPERGEKDYRLDAKLSIEAYTQIIIHLIREYNHTILHDYPLDQDMVKAGLVPTPINLWNWGMKYRYVGLHNKPKDIIRLNLLPNGVASVTFDRGIYFRKMKLGYTCDMAKESGWFEKARNSGVWSVKITYDPRNLNHIYLPDSDGLGFIKCDLLPQYAQHFGNLCEKQVDILHISERANIQESQTEQQILKSDTHAKVVQIIENETQLTDALRDPDLSRAEIIRQTDENRLDQRNKSQVVWKLGLDADSKTKGNVIPFRCEDAMLDATGDNPDTSKEEDEEIYDLLKSEISRRNRNETN
ncbi:Mu transposase C-terminal domain-containing protein [Paenibacillus chitinolyticus]|uniref:Mu transposase C-terminal domain-containing protein n=1 Tax=Paenibacillus chitinolyticus TaxID=79263 RepID=UPI001C462428|nr:Mu transposase C-terminal domain-containing protein [Paenibacillus chitinolyticus]MBV6716561.1 Mu transposase C-terminal domain-containing protein [Paenibacillus chitinolyticus]